MTKRTLVVGASEKPYRYSNKAIRLLRRYDHPVVAIGLREGRVEDVEIKKGFPDFEEIHTVTLYVGPPRQPQFYDYILGLRPERIIFNPGTENDEFEELAAKNGIEVVENCTLVMLSSGLF
jgi:predicted CoA-binding protein